MFKSALYVQTSTILKDDKGVPFVQGIADLFLNSGKGWAPHKEAIGVQTNNTDGHVNSYVVIKSAKGHKLLINARGVSVTWPTNTFKVWATILGEGDASAPRITQQTTHGLRLTMLTAPESDFNYDYTPAQEEFYPDHRYLADASKPNTSGSTLNQSNVLHQFGIGENCFWWFPKALSSATEHEFFLLSGEIVAPESSSNPMSKYASLGTSSSVESHFDTSFGMSAPHYYFMKACGIREDGTIAPSYSSANCMAFSPNLLHQDFLHSPIGNTVRWGNVVIASKTGDYFTPNSRVLGQVDASILKYVPSNALSPFQLLDGGSMIHLVKGVCVWWSPTNPPIFTSGE